MGVKNTTEPGARLFAQDIPVGLAKAFRKRLIDDELSFRAWLIAAMKAYLQQPRGKP